MDSDNILEQQIGNLGSEPNDPQTTPKGLGKLTHKAAYGAKEALTEQERAERGGFLSRSANKMQSFKGKHGVENDSTNVEDSSVRYADDFSVSISDGWIPIDRKEMGMRSLFYPQSWKFYVRAATVNSIKNWTAIDENRADELNRVFNDIIKTCVKIETTDINKASWDMINSWDRFWFILKIRECTFVKGESKVEFEDSCSECNEDIIYTLTSHSLYYDYPDEDIIEKYWDGTKWVIDPSEYGLKTDESITLYIPKILKDDAIIEWATNKVRNKQKIDETFVKYLVWLLDKPAKDIQMLDRQIQKIYNDYKKWDLDTFAFITDVIDNININPSERLKTVCPSCSREATSTVQFPNGIKALFAVKTAIKKFGSR